MVDVGTGRSVGAGREGEIWLRGPELFAGYLDPSETRQAVAGGWFRTGDLGRMDDDGFLSVVGRVKELIIRQGENIALEGSLEPALRQILGLLGMAVALRDERLVLEVRREAEDREEAGVDEVVVADDPVP